jgi:hypothetical protein
MGCAQAVSNERDERCADGWESQSKKPKRRIEGEREMLLPITCKPAKAENQADKPARTPTRTKKAS